MDDKTTKIPSLKEFQNAQKEQEKRQQLRKITPNNKKRNIKGDTHRLDLSSTKKKPSKYPPDKKPQKPNTTSHSTQKIYNKNINEPEDRFKAFESDVSYKRREPKNSKPLTQTRVAGSRPQPSKSPVNRPPQNVSSVRRKTKKKKPLSPFARKVRRVLVYGLIVLAILTIGIILSMTVLFKTENIVVEVPDNFYSSEDIISVSGLHYQDNIFMAGKSRAETRIEEAFPYVKNANIYAVIPDTIKIDITLSNPSFAVKTDKLTYIANEDCKVLEVTSTADEAEVALIEGVSVSDAKVGEILEFESTLVKDSLAEMFSLAKEKGYNRITRVDFESGATSADKQTMEIRYVYDDRIVVYIGLPENITYKMRTAQTIIEEKLDVNGAVLTGELDVSQCFDTKKSYFNQYSLIPEVVITEPSTQATEATEYFEEYDYEEYDY